MAGIVRIVGFTDVNRASMKEEVVLRKAHDEMKKYKPYSNEIKLFSQLLREKCIKLVGTSEEGPVRQVSYRPNPANASENAQNG